MGKARILIVEDEAITAKDIQHTLESKGFEVIAIASTGEDAIKRVEEHKPDLVLMDIILKGDIDGITTTEEIKSRYNIPIVYLTAHSDDITLSGAKITEPHGYILKPVNENELYTTIVTALYKHDLETILKESEVRYRTLFENSKNGIAIYRTVNNGEDFIFVDLNKAGEAIENVKREKLIGKSVLDMFPAVNESGLLEIFKRVWKSGNPESHATSEYKDDKITNLKEHYVYKLSSDEIVDIFSDETARKHAEDELIRMLIRRLSPKEIEFLRNIRKGLSRKEISRKMNITESTYDNHFRNIKNKLNIKERGELMKFTTDYKEYLE